VPVHISRLGRGVGLLGALVILALCAASNAVASASASQTPVRAAFLGDSYTYGVGASQHTNGYAYLVAQAEHWDATISGWPGSGYVRHATQDGKTIAAGLPRVIASHAQVVIVECGHNDADPGVPYRNTERNAVRDLRTLRAGLPDATIVVLGPIWLNGHPSRQVLAVRNAVHAAQKQIPGSLWIDPIAERWFSGTLTSKIRTGDDATMINYTVGHPNDLGYEHIAGLLESDLHQLGIQQP
jgi:lysophospholipase L1-like esterase